MDYSRLVRDAWALTWRHKFLWVLGFFAGGGTGSCAGNGLSQGWPSRDDMATPGRRQSRDDVTWGDFTDWLGDNIELVLVLATIAGVLLLVLSLIHFVAAGGLIRAISELVQDRPVTLGQAWSAGTRFFWRFLGLALLQLPLWLILYGMGAAMFLAFGVRGAALGGLLLLVVSVPLTIVVVFAQCAIAIRDEGTIEAIGSAVALLRAQLGPSLLIWLLEMAVTIAAYVGLAIGMLIAAIPIVVVAVVLYFVSTVALVVFLVSIGVAALAGTLVLVGIAGTWMWGYWVL